MTKKNEPIKSKIDPEYGKGIDINYMVVKGSDIYNLAMNVNAYMEKNKGFKPIGGVAFVSDGGENFYMQALYNREM